LMKDQAQSWIWH